MKSPPPCPRNDLSVVRLGEHDLDDPSEGPHEDVAVEEELIHESYSPVSFANDIAILKLARPVRFRDNVKPLCLPFGDAFVGRDLTGEERWKAFAIGNTCVVLIFF